ncbi:MAG: glucose 1-dehydrogenase [Oscillospiraceae bacterium]|nr:glucose 1-dehydrogenase [Oscillospiraceae bacterium]
MQKVLVTGASAGIGRLTAVAFAKKGANVAINYNRSESGAAETLRLVEAEGARGYTVRGDVSVESEAARLVDESAKLLGGLDVLVNNTGVTRFIPFPNLDAATTEVWDELYKVNVEGAFFCARAASKIMQKQDGQGVILFISSVAGMLPRGSSIPYSVSKAAVIHVAKCLAQVLAPKIRVNCISPGVIQNTRWNDRNPDYDPQTYQGGAGAIPLGRLGEPEDIADAAVFLASDAASFITGINLPIEGGANIK